jgi:hypothetical protein
MMQRSIAWLAKQPDADKWLGALAEPEPVEPEPRRRPPADPEPVGNPWTELSAKATSLAERVDKLVDRRGDDRWAVLLRDGYPVESVERIARFGVEQGIADPREAAKLLERQIGYPEPAVSTGGRYFAVLDRAAGRDNAAAFQALMDGDDETWLAHSIPAALREIRGQ